MMLQKIKSVKLLSELKITNQHDLKKDANKKLLVKMNGQFINQWACVEVDQGKTHEIKKPFYILFIDENMLMFVFTVAKGIFAIGLVLGPRTSFRLLAIL